MLREVFATIYRVISWPFRVLANLFCPCFDPPEFKKGSPIQVPKPQHTVSIHKAEENERRNVERSKSEDIRVSTHLKPIINPRSTDDLQIEFDKVYKKKKQQERIKLRLEIMEKIPPKPNKKAPTPSPYNDSEPNGGTFFKGVKYDKKEEHTAEQKTNQLAVPKKKSAAESGLMQTLSSFLTRKQ